MTLWGTKKWNVLISYHFLQMFKPLKFFGWPPLWQINNWRIIYQSSSMMGINFVMVALTNNEKQKAPRDNFDKSIEGKLNTWFINTFPVYPALILLHLTRSNSLLSQACFCDFPLSNFTKKKKNLIIRSRSVKDLTQHIPFVSFLFLFLTLRRKNRLKYLKNMGDFPFSFHVFGTKYFQQDLFFWCSRCVLCHLQLPFLQPGKHSQYFYIPCLTIGLPSPF